MPLMYTHIDRRVTVTKTQRVFTAPKHWSCFTPRTNTSLRKKAETAIGKVEKATHRLQVRNALFAFYKGWFKMCDSSVHQHAGVSDTAVREVVRGFGSDLLSASGYYSDADGAEEDIYRDVQSLPASELRHISNKD